MRPNLKIQARILAILFSLPILSSCFDGGTVFDSFAHRSTCEVEFRKTIGMSEGEYREELNKIATAYIERRDNFTQEPQVLGHSVHAIGDCNFLLRDIYSEYRLLLSGESSL